MARSNKHRVLIWIIVVLLATNFSMAFSFMYHKYQDKKAFEAEEETVIEVPTEQRTRFFREQLDLSLEQTNTFRELNRNFNRNARQINFLLEGDRVEMVTELGKENPNTETLNTISGEIGKLHTDLKNLTIEYYLQMKDVCDEAQKEKLNKIFMSVLEQNEDVRLPQSGRNRINTE